MLTLASGVLLLCAATPFVDAIRPALLAPVQSLGRLWLLLALLGVVLAVIARAWGATVTFVVAAILPLVTLVSFQGGGCTPGTTRLTVMSINAELAQASVDQIVAEAERRDPDVLVVVEVTEPMIEQLLAGGLDEDLQYRTPGPVADNGASGTVIISRYAMDPVDAAQVAVAHEQPAVRLDVDGRAVTFRAIHTMPPVEGSLAHWRDGLREIGDWQSAYRGRPLILAGDFNASAAHAPYRDAKRGLTDAAGRWAPATWPADRAYPPFADIDHVLTRGFTALDSGTFEVDGTDHLGVWADLAQCR